MSVLISIFFLSVIALSEQDSSWWKPKPGQHVRHMTEYAQRLFEETAEALIAIDRKTQEKCEEYHNNLTREKLETSRYSLTIPFADFNDSEVVLEIRHRVLYIKAYNEQTDKSYVQITQLPEFIITQEASYKLEDGSLSVYFPLKNVTTCAERINDDVVRVPVVNITTLEA